MDGTEGNQVGGGAGNDAPLSPGTIQWQGIEPSQPKKGSELSGKGIILPGISQRGNGHGYEPGGLCYQGLPQESREGQAILRAVPTMDG